MYNSVHKMYQQWPADTRIYVGHDYPPGDRPVSFWFNKVFGKKTTI
jgi:hypothetical protein